MRGFGDLGRGAALALALGSFAACGGSSGPPPETPPGAGASSGSEAPPSQPRGNLEGPAAPASSDDVKNGIAALKSGDLNGARAAFEAAIQKNPKKADAYHYLGVVQDQSGQRGEAEKSFRKALEIDPNLEESATDLAAILVEAGKLDEAAALMKKAVARNPRNAALRVNLGMALSGKNDVDGASKEFEEAARLEPNNGIHLVTHAAHLSRSGKKDEATAKLRQAEKVAASDAGILSSVALEYKGLKDFKSCVSVLDRAIGLKDVAELRVYRGACKLGLKDLPGATAEFKDAVAKEPNNALAHYTLGNALADGGKLSEAIAEWETCLKLAPDGPQAKAAEKKIALAKTKEGGKKK